MNFKDLEALCRNISMPQKAAESVQEAFEKLPCYPEKEISMLCSKESWEEGLNALKKQFSETDHGFSLLAVSLCGALKAKERYEKLGIPDEVFYDTMGCFSRFVKEHKESFGDYGFDREWWTPRQLSCLLFRLKTLEFEMGTFQGEPSLRIHIPSDGEITEDNVRESFHMAGEFFETYFPDFQYANMSCSSWLLAPNLKDVLPESSNILKFQKNFNIVGENPQDKEYVSWIFKNNKLPVTGLPENTSLQRNVKKYMLEGKNIGSGDGIVIS